MPTVNVIITGRLDLSDGDVKLLRKADPSLVAQTLCASGKDVRVSFPSDKPRERRRPRVTASIKAVLGGSAGAAAEINPEA